MFFTHYTLANAVTDLFHLTGEKNVKKAAVPYFNEMCGGHGRESVGNAILYAKKGFDGLIQLAPFTCIPEIVAKSILPAVGEKYGIGILSITIDEQTGKAGLQTRLEAFVDLLARKREKRRKGNIA
jgi:predicted nucleotide-binding protein (sugar kinase/HSP70/actin superfamily)